MTGRKFTWTNNLALQNIEKLDRILITTEWEEKFQLSTVRALTREISDHTSLLLNTPMFKYELGWLLRDGFIDMIRGL
jgi:hypothetical protein